MLSSNDELVTAHVQAAEDLLDAASDHRLSFDYSDAYAYRAEVHIQVARLRLDYSQFFRSEGGEDGKD